MSKPMKKLTIYLTVLATILSIFVITVFAANTTSVTLANKTSNSFTVNVTFPVSGATGNKLELFDQATKKTYNFDGITQANVLNGAYTAKNLTPDTTYIIRLTYLSDNKSVYKDYSLKTAQAIVQAPYKQVTPQQAYAMMQKYKNYTILDVRPKTEYDKSRIAGAISMPYADVANRAPAELKDKYALIFVYCAAGCSASSLAANDLDNMGYMNVFDIKGGITAWPYGTASGSTNTTAIPNTNTTAIANTTASTNTTQPSSSKGYTTITPQQAYTIMQKNKNYTLIDVRPKANYDLKRIDGAISMPYADLASRAPVELPNKNALIFVICQKGVTSPKASADLVAMGYTNVYEIGGGMDNWPYATVSNTTTANTTAIANTTSNTTTANTTAIANTTSNTTTTNTTASTNTTQPSSSKGYTTITPQQAYTIMQQNKNYTLIDVRPKANYDLKRIDGAISMPYADLASRAPVELPNKNALILVICQMGVTSPKAAADLVAMGYTNIYEISGGMNNWPYATVSN
ncbi:MAG: rhodanese-like domain-containing protein [Oscillospiraceae bacterium]|nr:rhodanese-like domain-containing protein [Oscillospiraceae bacterium]